MTAIPERAIDRDFARLRLEDIQNFLDHDRAMRAGRCFARRQDFRDSICVTRRIVFFVFLFEPARVFAGVARAAAVRSGLRRIGLRIASHLVVDTKWRPCERGKWCREVAKW